MAATPDLGLLESRVDSLLRVADEHGVGLDVPEIADFLPATTLSSESELRVWLRERPHLGALTPDGVVRRPAQLDAGDLALRRARAVAYLDAADRLFRDHLAGARMWLRFAGVTGSAAFGVAAAQDDCDLFVVTQRGTTWLFLAYAFGRLRLRSPAGDGPPFCLNHILDESAVEQEYRGPNDFLFVREALTVRPVHGAGYYRGLLRRARWLGEAAPRRYARWLEGSTVAPTSSEPPASILTRLANAVAFVALASYLQLKGLVVNARLRRSGHADEQFRTITRPGLMAFETRRYERLRRLYRSPD